MNEIVCPKSCQEFPKTEDFLSLLTESELSIYDDDSKDCADINYRV